MCSSSRLKEIVKLCHSKNVPVIVDEAHGSHLHFLGRPDMLGMMKNILRKHLIFAYFYDNNVSLENLNKEISLVCLLPIRVPTLLNSYEKMS